MVHLHAFVVLACIATIALGKTICSVDKRIVGGSDAPEGAFPYQVALRRLHFPACGGSIINKNWILTAAHCLGISEPEYVFVVVGSNTLNPPGQEYKVEKIIIHEDYDFTRLPNDIALLKLSSDLEFSERVQPIQLETGEVGEGEPVILSGWGILSYPDGCVPNHLQHITLKSISNAQCERAHASFSPVLDSQICTFTKVGEGSCKRDSGGPLVHAVKKTLVGIVSWSMPCATETPDVFTRVSSFADWIHKHISE